MLQVKINKMYQILHLKKNCCISCDRTLKEDHCIRSMKINHTSARERIENKEKRENKEKSANRKGGISNINTNLCLILRLLPRRGGRGTTPPAYPEINQCFIKAKNEFSLKKLLFYSHSFLSLFVFILNV